MKGLVCGLGFNDMKGMGQTKSYRKWKSMIISVSKGHSKVCEEWKKFSNFHTWYMDNYEEGKHLFPMFNENREKFHSPSTSFFAPKDVVSFMRKLSLDMEDIKLTRDGYYKATFPFKGKPFYCGNYPTQEEATKVRDKVRTSMLRKELRQIKKTNPELTELVDSYIKYL